MKNDHVHNVLIDYLEGNLDKERRALVANHLSVCDECNIELVQTKELLAELKNVPQQIPSSKLRDGFYEMLENEKADQDKIVSLSKPNNFNWNRVWQSAAVIAFIFSAFMFGKYQQQNKNQEKIDALVKQTDNIKQSMLLALVENQSASKRVQGVHYVNQVQTPNSDVLDALIKRMHLDENANVRLAAIEALSKFTNTKMVRDELIVALGQEKDPGLQVSLIEILVSIQEKGAKESMERLLQKEDTPTYVKDQVKIGLPSII
ncbi:HEAT repeat domain-containing protein [Spongiivirga citrea]|uniref:Putative zinc-finger domain-containing protein n=1 Tax=Spongiivirga citrea TaxID=1481457 RepID=A0A6M0CMD0_9FLAO|nr:HEAT repeat domain-containing protein [Spongiivirga citrea]NER17164.1 hypothetical protein [Spongiivirga citrea]